MNLEEIHVPVLLKEVLYYLNLKQGDIIFDGTLGGAGHTVEIIKAIAPTGKVIGVDLHGQTISTATSRLRDFSKNVVLVNDNFANIKKILKRINIKSIDGMLLDLGLSSFLIEKSKRGFSYLKNEKLDMRFGNGDYISAFDVVNKYSQGKLTEIFRKYGEERWSKSIAKNIVNHRKSGDIKTTGELVEIIKDSIPRKLKYQRRGHPAKRIFQAIRMEVNKELDNLKMAIEDGFKMLKSGGRMVIISYHSLEDRMVKSSFLEYEGKCTCPPDFPVCKCGREKRAEIITKKVVRPGLEEISSNPRSKNARLRVLEKL
ncbi:MAG: 16S rRNA (cytosine(1402)-N(4))-methyltransferase RsmH [Actinobacteria bacterium]|nr:MAG: 16S rRNA (cytosine(1402)-N(4))-methyltransferase RsmH [Actinomycetota bacterium]